MPVAAAGRSVRAYRLPREGSADQYRIRLRRADPELRAGLADRRDLQARLRERQRLPRLAIEGRQPFRPGSRLLPLPPGRPGHDGYRHVDEPQDRVRDEDRQDLLRARRRPRVRPGIPVQAPAEENRAGSRPPEQRRSGCDPGRQFGRTISRSCARLCRRGPSS